jgi:hypothetical protein
MQKDKNLFLLKEWSLLSTFHCYPKIFQTKSIYAKLIWSLIFVLFSCLTFWLVVKGIVEYFEFDVVTKIRVISPQSITFPTVTICEANMFTTKEAEELISEALLLENETISTLASLYDQYNGNEKERFEMNTLIDLAIGRLAHFNESMKKSMGLSFDQIQKCHFDYREECELDWVFSNKHGNCYQFNSGKRKPKKETKLGGRRSGLYLQIGPLINRNSFSTYYSTGLKLFIHNGSFVSTGAEEIFIKTGEQTNIKLNKILTRKATYPHSTCQDVTKFQSNTFNLIKSFQNEYHQRDCIDICLQNLIIIECNCLLAFLPEIGNCLPCVNSSQKACLNRVYENKTRLIQEKCENECPLECDYTSYDWSMSSLVYPSVPYFNSIRKNSKFYSNFTFAEYKESHSMINIFFESVEYTEIVETPMISFLDLISNLGGVLGIFLGFSIFSLVELIELILKFIFLNFFKSY